MWHLRLLSVTFLITTTWLASSCNNSSNKSKANTAENVPVNDAAAKTRLPSSPQQGSDPGSNASENNGDTSLKESENSVTDSVLSQMKGLTSMFGKHDSATSNNSGAGGKMDSMMMKMQSLFGGKSTNPGDAVATSVLNMQLGQMKINNPLKSVATGMLNAQKNGTAGPDKKYTATYAAEQPVDYSIPLSGTGSTIILRYSGGCIVNNKKDGLWKNIYINTNRANKWNIYSEAYTESSSLNIKVHSTSLASKSEIYTIILNDQYKKYYNQPRSEMGKNESEVLVQKIGIEKMFGYNCVHVKISYTLKALGQTSNIQDDEWYSADVPGAQFLSPHIFENHSPSIVNKIIEAGCSGALVKSIISSTGSLQMMQLSRINQEDMPDSTFNLPISYQEDKNTALYDIK